MLPWYKGQGREMGKYHFSGVHTVIRTYTQISLSKLLNYVQKVVVSVRHSWDVGFKNPELYYSAFAFSFCAAKDKLCSALASNSIPVFLHPK